MLVSFWFTFKSTSPFFLQAIEGKISLVRRGDKMQKKALLPAYRQAGLPRRRCPKGG
jgi:hypothetical protein